MAIYMNYNSIPGDVTETNHTTWIELDSFQWGVARGISSPVGSSAERESTAPAVSEVIVTKENDISSGKLMTQALSARYGDDSLRLVYPADAVHIEKSPDPNTFIMTSVTPDGFAVSFSLSRQQLHALSESGMNA